MEHLENCIYIYIHIELSRHAKESCALVNLLVGVYYISSLRTFVSQIYPSTSTAEVSRQPYGIEFAMERNQFSIFRAIQFNNF